VVAVDATQAESLAQKYGIQGFPTLKMFGQDKRKPSDYNGGRTSDAIISECMKSANQLVKARKSGGNAGAKKSSGSSSSGSGAESGAGSGSNSGGSKSRGSEVIELTELNFNALVMESNDHWLVEFYAPW
jgi:protein disulfide-isomerase A6